MERKRKLSKSEAGALGGKAAVPKGFAKNIELAKTMGKTTKRNHIQINHMDGSVAYIKVNKGIK